MGILTPFLLTKVLSLIGISVTVVTVVLLSSIDIENDTDVMCKKLISDELVADIERYGRVVEKIIESTTIGSFRHKVWDELALFVDSFGNRLVGSPALENAIDYMLMVLEWYGLDNVHGENVYFTPWVRGNESAFLTSPRLQQLNILGLGYSIGTSNEGIEADVLVVESFDELKHRASEALGKIVVLAIEWFGYHKSAEYRIRGASEVAKVGGVAVLICSTATFSINSPHTGLMFYEDGVTQVPAASLTIEDSQMLLRMSRRGSPLRIRLHMGAHFLPKSVSRNTVAELRGTSQPEKVVVVSGHLDSWDVGSGAMDDGGGAFISWVSLVLLKSLGLRPQRTIRAVLWTAEELALVGAKAYAESHKYENNNFIVMMESDYGTFSPLGLQYAGSDYGGCIIKEILKLMSPLEATQFMNSPPSDVGSDITVWAGQQPLISNLNANDRYFWFHHSRGDTMNVEDPDDLDKNLALWAATAYILADMTVDFPKPTFKFKSTS